MLKERLGQPQRGMACVRGYPPHPRSPVGGSKCDCGVTPPQSERSERQAFGDRGAEGTGKAGADKKCGSVADTNSGARQGGERASTRNEEREPNAKRSEHRGGKPPSGGYRPTGRRTRAQVHMTVRKHGKDKTERRLSMSGSEDTDRKSRESVAQARRQSSERSERV